MLKIEEFKKLNEEEQKELLISWRSQHNNGKIAEEMGIPMWKFSKLISKFDLSNPKGSRKNKAKVNPVIVSEELYKAKEEAAVTAEAEVIPADRSLIPVVIPAIEIYVDGNIPATYNIKDLEIKGMSIIVCIKCNNPELIMEAQDICSAWKTDLKKSKFFEGSLAIVGYINKS